MKVLNDSLILQRGRGPVVMEPVKADITVRRPGSPIVYLLDHSGAKTANDSADGRWIAPDRHRSRQDVLLPGFLSAVVFVSCPRD